MIDVILHPDDRLALLVAVHHLECEGVADERAIRARLSSQRLPGGLLKSALGRLHSEGLLIPELRRGWRLTADGWCEVVRGMSPEPEAVPA